MSLSGVTVKCNSLVQLSGVTLSLVLLAPTVALRYIQQAAAATFEHTCQYIGEFFQGGFLGMKVVTFATLRADLEDFFKCRR